MNDRERRLRAVEALANDIPCCGCCAGDSSYKELTQDVAVILGYQIEWSTVPGTVIEAEAVEVVETVEAVEAERDQAEAERDQADARRRAALEYMASEGCTLIGTCKAGGEWEDMCFACIAKEVLSTEQEK